MLWVAGGYKRTDDPRLWQTLPATADGPETRISTFHTVSTAVMKRLCPLAPPKVQPKPLALKETIDDSHLLDTSISFEPPTVQIKSSVASGTFSGPRDASARPIFRVNPNYPIEASRNGIEGWVVLGFDIDKIGQVVNVKVINAEPKRIFNKAAKQALRKWKYQAKTVDGQQVMQRSLTVQLDFKMDQST